jgi:hypothetical protein
MQSFLQDCAWTLGVRIQNAKGLKRIGNFVVALFLNPILEVVECLEQVSILFGFKVT